MRATLLTCALAVTLFGAMPALAQAEDPPAVPEPSEPAMTLDRMGGILAALDPDARQDGASFQLTLADIPVIVITDPRSDRMRAMVPIRSADGLEPDELMRLMQANFDSALDARYAVARGRLWGVFIHPLSPLEREQLISGLVQTINLARTYGQTYSGGAQVFGGGDSNDIYRELFEELLNRGKEL